MPKELQERALKFVRGEIESIPVATAAATVVLARDTRSGLEVLLMRRPRTMSFAPGMAVFPGGRLDELDHTIDVRGAVPGGDWGSESLSRALMVTGVRETFEEVGVLLAAHGDNPPRGPDEDWNEDRSNNFAAVLRRRGLTIESRLLTPTWHWITPEVESRRYDTRFFLAAMPAGQAVLAHDSETDGANWWQPANALAEYARGALPMLPPTAAVLADLAGRQNLRAALEWALGTKPSPILPRPTLRQGSLSWDLVHGYTGDVLAPGREPAGSEALGLESTR